MPLASSNHIFCVYNFKILFLVFIILFLCKIEAKYSHSSKISDLCGLGTAKLMKHYGYEAKKYTVKTEDGYILTLFRCISKNSTIERKKPVVVHHGLLLSSDDYCLAPPNQSLTYVLADAGYDVWLANSRGNLYSRKHVTKDPDNPSSGFWNFSWYEIGVYDLPAVTDFILKETNHSKLLTVGHSQGSTTLMTFLSERPEYNEKIYAASLLSPTAYFNQNDLLFKTSANLISVLQLNPNIELFPRGNLVAKLATSICADNISLCNNMLNIFGGPSDNQRNNTILPSFLCNVPSGASLKQLLHYAQCIQFDYFGKYKYGPTVPSDFPLSKITAPIGLHFSTADTVIYPAVMHKLIPKLKNSDVYVHTVTKPNLNHVDFIWGRNSASLVYTKILKFFEKYT